MWVQGKLQAAIAPFEEATQLVSFRSRTGGEAMLQKAICLDSLVMPFVLQAAIAIMSKTPDAKHSLTKSTRKACMVATFCLPDLTKSALLQGRNEEAMALYKLISRHSAPHVAKSAKRLLFGFTAGDYLKAHTMTYVTSCWGTVEPSC